MAIVSRSGYTDDCENLAMWRGAVRSAIRGKRGQALLKELAAALDAMPEKALAADSLVTADGAFCTLGVLGAARDIDLEAIDPEDPDQVAQAFGIAPAMAQEIVYENDERDDDHEWVTAEVCGPVRPHWPEYGRHERSCNVPVEDGPARRWKRMRKWVAARITTQTPASPEGAKENDHG